MKIESPAFTADDVRSFFDSYHDRERGLLADRLAAASARLAVLGRKVKRATSDDVDWNAHELLAHIAVLSKYYGVLVHRIASGQLTQLDLLEAVHLRDTTGHQMAQLEPGDLVRTTLADHERTIKTLREAGLEDLRRSADVGDGMSMTAEEIARLPLVSHLEIHVGDLERLLAAVPEGSEAG
jgi:hypothetical protein